MTATSFNLSIVVPVYREAQNIPVFIQRITTILHPITETYEIIFALDPSPDASADVIADAHRSNPKIKCLEFSRRFGQPAATLAGMQYAKGDAVIVMDVDLQDPPELIPQMIAKWQAGFDVVYAQRSSRKGQNLIYRLVTRVGYKIIHTIARGIEIPENTGDFRLLSRRAVAEILKLKESHGFLRGLTALVGFRQTSVVFDRPARYAGATNYNRFVGSLRIGVNGIVCFSNVPLALSLWMGFLIMGAAVILACLALLMFLLDKPIPIQHLGVGVLVMLLSSVQLISVGILGEYIGRIYEEVKDRPRFIVDKSLGFKEPS